MRWLRPTAAALAVIALAFAAIAGFTPVSADFHPCGSAVFGDLQPIRDAITFDQELGPQLGANPQNVATGAQQTLHDCQHALNGRREQAGTALVIAVLLAGGLAGSQLLRRRRRPAPESA
jgi:hypothetical protein